MSDLTEDYKNSKHLYESLLIQARHTITSLLRNTDIEIFSIESRLKDEGSFKEKLQRKSGYKVLSDIEDLCGLRIICYYESDLEKLEKLLSENFTVLSSSDKKQETDVDKFGYSSNHFIVKFKDDWLNIPMYNTLEGLKFEIQIRTMLMHTWAAISHTVLYKHESDAPRHMRRTFSQLSALIELADEQFSRIKEMKLDYINNISSSNENYSNLELNSDTLLSLINNYFPDRDVIKDNLTELLADIKNYDTLVKPFEEKIKACINYLPELEKDIASLFNILPPIWTAHGMCFAVLALTNPQKLMKLMDNNSELDLNMHEIYQSYADKINYTA
ncbi:GTP pyrophosphokinase [Morganella morganii]|uniref:GTP pyrophosphokinase n=1 Tax=Morganella morganii TaxID=582 RepID=UPI003D7F908D